MLRGLKSSHSLLCFLFAAFYESAHFYFFMDVKTFITVQGQCRKLCIQTETVQVATRGGLSLEEGDVNAVNVCLPFQDVYTTW